VTVCDRGTGQGSVISPLLANVYLHYAFDLWAERWRHREATGTVIIVLSLACRKLINGNQINGNQMPRGGRRIGAGRPVGSGNKTPPELREIARAHSPRAFERVLELIESKDERVALAASKEVLAGC
jgi:hypothetical protein